MNKNPWQGGRRADVLRVFGFTLFTTASYVVYRIVADTVLLSRLGTGALPPMLVISALTVGAVSFFWANRTHNLPLGKLILVTQIAGALCTATLVFLMRASPSSTSIICLLHVLAELRGCFNVIQVAVLLNETFCSETEQSKFALVNSGAPLAGILVGVFVGFEANTLAPSVLLLASCVLDLLAIFSINPTTSGMRVTESARKLPSPEIPTIIDTTSIESPARPQIRTLARAVFWLVVCKTIVLSIVAFEWKVFASRAFANSEQQLAMYFGIFYAVSDGLILLIQLFVTRLLLVRIGAVLCIFILPVCLTALGLASLVTHQTWVLLCILTAARGSSVIRRSIHDVALQILYGAFPGTTRRTIVAKVLGGSVPLIVKN